MTTPTSADCERAAVESRHLGILIFSGSLLWLMLLGVSLLSWQFGVEHRLAGRPVRSFVIMMSLAFVLYLLALRSAVRLKNGRRATWWILLFAVAYRSVLLPSVPIQEIDIYRYMWDGAVVAAGGNPYQFSPRDVRETPTGIGEDALQPLLKLRDRDDSARLALQRIHYAHLTTIYPPVSQAVFAAAAWATPQSATIRTRMILTKLCIVAFDLLAVLGLLRLLRLFHKADGWVVCYAWSPLVLKEFANSGHLDAIAVGITVWAIYWWMRAMNRQSWSLLLLSAAVLGLGTGAKLYPVVVVPVVAVSVLRQFRWQGIVLSGAMFCGVTSLTLAPMLIARPQASQESLTDHSADSGTIESGSLEELPAPPIPELVDSAADATQRRERATVEPPVPEPQDVLPIPITQPSVTQMTEVSGGSGRPRKQTGAGLTKFLSSWKMNDFFFLIIQENLIVESKAWFSILPRSWKQAATGPVRRRTGQSESDASFLIARAITAGLHLAIVLWLAGRAWWAKIDELPRLAFLCIAWFWLLLPTLNPWYWIWAMPLLPFVRQRSWLLLSGCVMVYYLRFYLRNDCAGQEILHSGYYGADFFHYVIVWLEYVPLLLLLAVEWWWSSGFRRPPEPDSSHGDALPSAASVTA
ncbi:MAG: hypothetical protein NXI04_08820 [Planctomycetaceae bacterium]|nr:hypothetical protein [Planctomycetaceae bacterium]